MSLRSRLLMAIFLALLISFSLGAALAVWQARSSVAAEQAAALANARESTVIALINLPQGAGREAALRRFVSAFDGSRHLRASLTAPDGATLMASVPAAAPPTPAWLREAIVTRLKPVIMPVGNAGAVATLRLDSVPLNEAAERWSDLRERMASLGLFFLLAALLCSVTASRGLRPLTSLAQGLQRVGRGEAAPTLPVTGPIETVALAEAFNDMQAALDTARQQNQLLARQIITIAEEERAEIARDLHDEIGPLLFAITAFAAAVGRQVETGELAPVRGQIDSIQQTVTRLQQQVRDMLGRLRDGGLPSPDLTAAMHELVVFWRRIRPETQFTLSLDAEDENWDDATKDCLFRAAQECVSNAIRHGNASRVDIRLDTNATAIRLQVLDNGLGGAEGVGAGLAGMRTRAALLCGDVTITRDPGWTVAITLPLRNRVHSPAAPLQAAGA